MGFAAEWLAMREPADHQARDKDLLRRAADVAGPKPVILDLGCGTGSTIRALTPYLPREVSWRLVDNDADLLKIAGEEAKQDAILHLLNIENLDELPIDGATLVTASALLDLVTERWLSEFLDGISVPVYFALTYDGQMSWSPEDSRDAEITAAFNAHQQTDKGMGPALGPKASEVTVKILEDAGFEVFTADSPWILSPEHKNLQQELVSGIAQAASDVGNLNADSWAIHRNSTSGSECRVGHKDILAIPKGLQRGSSYAIS